MHIPECKLILRCLRRYMKRDELRCLLYSILFLKKIEQEQTLFNDLRQGPFKGNKKDPYIKEGVPLHFEITVRKERVGQR